MSKKKRVPRERTKDPFEEFLLKLRDDFVMSLHKKGIDGIDIAFIINRSRQLVSHIIKKRSKEER